jgi:PAS domain S-box-containing protein
MKEDNNSEDNNSLQGNENTSFWAKVFREFYNASMDGLWIIDTQSRFKDVNPAYCQLIGYSREELLTMSVPDIEARESPEMVRRHIEHIIAEGKTRFETVHRRKDGSLVEVEVSATFLDSEDEHFFLIFVRDLTEHKRMEVQIQHRLAIEEAIAQASRLFISPDGADLRQVLMILGETTAVNRAYIFQFRESSQKVIIQPPLTPALSHRGEGVEMTRGSEQLRQKVVSQKVANNVANTYNVVNTYIVANTYEWCDPETKPQIDTLAGMDAATFTWGIGNLEAGENVVIKDISKFPSQAEAERKFAQALGARSILAVPIRSRSAALMGIMGFDNTELERDWAEEDIQALRVVAEMVGASWEHKRADEEREKIQAQLLQAQKMEAIGLLAGGVAHDFNNRLTTILGYASLAIRKANKASPLLRDLNQITLSAERAANLTRQLLLFSRKQPPPVLTPLNLNRTADNLIKMLHRLIGEDIAISIDLSPDLWPVMMDEGNIEQVIMNLALNARDAMPKGGKLTIKTDNIILDEKYARSIPEAQPGQFVRLSVMDTGFGMSREIVSQIFEPFFTTKDAGKGTGLGLSVVYGIIKQHKGWINVYTEPGQGSVFRVYLPAFIGKPGYKPKPVTPQPETQGKGERILLVEDDEGVRGFTREALSESGYTVFEANSAQDALAVFEQEKGHFHMLLSDVVLPDQSGPELAVTLFSRQPELTILLTSGYTEQRTQCPVIGGQMCQFLQKPYAMTDLLQTVKKIIKSR